MIKLSDYLNYLNEEVIQARKKADENAIAMAKQYADDPYLKYFRVPRFTMPTVKMTIPIKINELDAETEYNFKRDYDAFVTDVNNNIAIQNQTKGLNIQPISKDEILGNDKIVGVFNKLEKYDYHPVRKFDEVVKKVSISDISKVFGKQFAFTESNDEGRKKEEEDIFSNVIIEALKNRYSPVSSKLNEIFIDPDTSKENDKGKLFLNLDVEMLEEGIRIRNVKDRNGNEVEEIVFE